MENTLLFYSKTLVAFQRKITAEAKKILSQEMNICVKKKNFIYCHHLYPLNFTLFEHPNHLGYFNHYLFEIGINKLYILNTDKESLLNTIRHELAHYITFIIHGPNIQDHGTEFRKICKDYGWSKSVYRAKIAKESIKSTNNDLAKKIKKLLSLSLSKNYFEAQLATEKANQLLLKHHIEKDLLTEEDKYQFVVVRIFQQKQISTKLQTIAAILESFLVKPIMNHGKSTVYLEIFGKKEDVEIAKYTAHFLFHHLDKLWLMEKKNSPMLKGLAAKNSFFRGLACGYKQGIKKIQNKYSSMLIQQKNTLTQNIHLAYPSLKCTTISYIHDDKAAKKGIERGKRLKINKGLQDKSNKFFLIT